MRDKNETHHPPPQTHPPSLSLSPSVSLSATLSLTLNYHYWALGTRIVSAPLVRCGTLKSPLISNLCSFRFSLVLSAYLEISFEQLWSFCRCISPHPPPPRISFVCIKSSSYTYICVFTEPARSQITPCLKGSVRFRYDL